MMSVRRFALVVFVLAPCVRARPAVAAPAQPAGPPTCAELERRLDRSGPEATAMQLSLLLLSAADSGCVPLARRLIDAGASLEARDRLGAMALARAARAGHVALVELFLARGAALVARHLFGRTRPLPARGDGRRGRVRM